MKKIKKVFILCMCIVISIYNIGIVSYAKLDLNSNVSLTDLRTGRTTKMNFNNNNIKEKLSIKSYIPEDRKNKKISINKDNMKLNNIIGDDNREEAINTMFPYSAVAYLEVNDNKGFTRGTAFMVNDNIAMTAAHCVKGRNNITIFPGYSKGSAPFGGANVTAYITDNRYDPNIWTSGSNLRNIDIHDWAILILDRNIGNKTGWLGTSAEMSSITGFVSYPEDKSKNGLPLQMYSPGKVVGWDSSNKIYFTHDTVGGSSGGPVMGINQKGEYYVFGICSYGSKINEKDEAKRKEIEKQIRYNFAQRFNDEIIGHLINIINTY